MPTYGKLPLPLSLIYLDCVFVNDLCLAPCPMVDTLTFGKYITYIRNVKSWEQCGRKCLDTPSCVVWGWITPSYGTASLRETCGLYSSHTSTTTVNNRISGHRGCVE